MYTDKLSRASIRSYFIFCEKRAEIEKIKREICSFVSRNYVTLYSSRKYLIFILMKDPADVYRSQMLSDMHAAE